MPEPLKTPEQVPREGGFAKLQLFSCPSSLVAESRYAAF
jgi:hypothetical protein